MRVLCIYCSSDVMCMYCVYTAVVTCSAVVLRLNAVQEERVCELEAELSRVSEETVDQQSLLTTIAQDKETISRWGEGGRVMV